MRHYLSAALVPCLASLAFAQEANLTVKPATGVTKIEVQTTITSKAQNETLMNGEAMGFGGRGGRGGGAGGGAAAGPQETSASQVVSFDEGDGWRQYHKVEALVESAGRDGELQENEIAGALAGKKVALQRDEEGNLVLIEGEGEDAVELDGTLARGIHMLDFSSLLPAKTVKVGESFEVGNFADALKGLMHPVAAERAQRGGRGQGGGNQGGGDQGGGRGQGGRGQGGRGQGGGDQGGARGGRGQGGFAGRGARGAANPLDDILGAEKMTWAGKGTLVSIENGIATIEMKATVTGKGSNEDIGLPAGPAAAFGRGGRGGRGGGQGGGEAPAGESKNDIALGLSGKILFDVDAGMITAIDLAGELNDKRESSFAMNRGGEEMELERKSTTEAKLTLKVSCAKGE